jgi:hypothetical protein
MESIGVWTNMLLLQQSHVSYVLSNRVYENSLVVHVIHLNLGS